MDPQPEHKTPSCKIPENREAQTSMTLDLAMIYWTDIKGMGNKKNSNWKLEILNIVHQQQFHDINLL